MGKPTNGQDKCTHGKPTHRGQMQCFCEEDARMRAVEDLGEWRGVFEAFNEQGMEGHHAMCLMDFRGISKVEPLTPNDDGTRYNMEWLVPIKNGDEFEVFDVEGKLVWAGTVTNCKDRVAERDSVFNFMPNEVNPIEWIKWFYWKDEYIAKMRRTHGKDQFRHSIHP